MTPTYAFLLCLIALVQGRSLLTTDGRPDTPSYEVKNSTRALEIRQYENATWAVAFGRSRWSVDFAAHSAGLALARYFKGGNVAHTLIKPTVPVIGTVLPRHPPHYPHKNGSHHDNTTHHKPHPHHGPSGPPAVALAAYIPAKYEGKAPLPDSPRVRILKTNSTEVYVHKFGGWAISWVVKHEIGHLATILKDLKICPRKGNFLVATYDAPWKVFGRRNEILWVKRPKHKHHNDTLSDGQSDVSMLGQEGLEALDVDKLFPDEFTASEEVPVEAMDEDGASELITDNETVNPLTLLQEYFENNGIQPASGDVQTA